jgi:hypothetical protein
MLKYSIFNRYPDVFDHPGFKYFLCGSIYKLGQP